MEEELFIRASRPANRSAIRAASRSSSSSSCAQNNSATRTLRSTQPSLTANLQQKGPYHMQPTKAWELPYGLRREVGSVRYIKPSISPLAHAMRSPRRPPSLGRTSWATGDSSPLSVSSCEGDGGFGFGSLQRSSSVPGLGSPSSRPGTPSSQRRPSSRAGRSSSFVKASLADSGPFSEKAVLKLPVQEVPAGVNQAILNPSIPFSGFPSLAYLRGSTSPSG